MVVLIQSVFARSPDEIRAERDHAARYVALMETRIAASRVRHDRLDEENYADQAARVRVHVLTYSWLLGEVDTAPVTGRRVTEFTIRDIAIEQAPGRDHVERNTHRYNDPERVFPEAVYDALAWATGEFDDPPRLG